MRWWKFPQGEGGRESGIRNTEYGIRNQAPRAGPDIRNPEYGIWNTELSPKVGHGEQEKGVNETLGNPEYGIRNTEYGTRPQEQPMEGGTTVN